MGIDNPQGACNTNASVAVRRGIAGNTVSGPMKCLPWLIRPPPRTVWPRISLTERQMLRRVLAAPASDRSPAPCLSPVRGRCAEPVTSSTGLTSGRGSRPAALSRIVAGKLKTLCRILHRERYSRPSAHARYGCQAVCSAAKWCRLKFRGNNDRVSVAVRLQILISPVCPVGLTPSFSTSAPRATTPSMAENRILSQVPFSFPSSDRHHGDHHRPFRTRPAPWWVAVLEYCGR